MSDQEATGSAPVADEAPSARDRMRDLLADRRALAIIGAALVAVIALAAFVVVPALKGSSNAAASSGLVPNAHHHTGSVSTATSTPSATPKPTTTVSALPVVHDPLSPLAAAVGAAGTGATATASGGATSVGVGSGGVASTGVGGTAATTVIESAPPGQLTQLVLAEINGATAKIVLNGVTSTVTKGEKFGRSNLYTMTAITATNATFAYKTQTSVLAPGEFTLFVN